MLVKCHLREISELSMMSHSFSDRCSEHSVMLRGASEITSCHRAFPWGWWPTLGQPYWLVPSTLSERCSGLQGLHTCCRGLGEASCEASLVGFWLSDVVIVNHGDLRSSTGGSRHMEGCTCPSLL